MTQPERAISVVVETKQKYGVTDGFVTIPAVFDTEEDAVKAYFNGYHAVVDELGNCRVVIEEKGYGK